MTCTEYARLLARGGDPRVIDRLYRAESAAERARARADDSDSRAEELLALQIRVRAALLLACRAIEAGEPARGVARAIRAVRASMRPGG